MNYKDTYKKIDKLLSHMPNYIKDFVQARDDQDQSPQTTLEYLKNYKPKLIIRKWIKKYYLFSSYAEIGFCYDHLGDVDSAKFNLHRALRYISRKQRHKYKAFIAKRLKYSI